MLLKKFATVQENTYRQQKCILCVNEGIQTETQYSTMRQYAAHLFQGLSANSWENKKSRRKNGMHTRIETIIIRHLMQTNDDKNYSCRNDNCTFRASDKGKIRSHVIENHGQDIVELHECCIQRKDNTSSDNIKVN